ncbi:very short patch repair endonuclease [Leisingera sp. JC1]|uniref:very short patch repair endonuclease n=1 Tax=Leisingera sp. JC1 TaxID=1855282 RepID=UPI0020C78DAF
MSGIRSANTKPEILLRKALFSRGLRYRLNDKRLPGKPDLVFVRLNAVIFVNGCFWHGHDCHLFKWPATRPDFWRDKIEGNSNRDLRVKLDLAKMGWRQGRVWECALKGRTKRNFEELISDCEQWLLGNETYFEVSGL